MGLLRVLSRFTDLVYVACIYVLYTVRRFADRGTEGYRVGSLLCVGNIIGSLRIYYIRSADYTSVKPDHL